MAGEGKGRFPGPTPQIQHTGDPPDQRGHGPMGLSNRGRPPRLKCSLQTARWTFPEQIAPNGPAKQPVWIAAPPQSKPGGEARAEPRPVNPRSSAGTEVSAGPLSASPRPQ